MLIKKIGSCEDLYQKGDYFDLPTSSCRSSKTNEPVQGYFDNGSQNYDQFGDDQFGDDQSGDNQFGDDQFGDDQSGDDQFGDDQSDDDQSVDNQSNGKEPGNKN